MRLIELAAAATTVLCVAIGPIAATPASPYAYSCSPPQSADEANLCIARASMKATRKQATWAMWTLIVSTAGTAVVIWTLQEIRKTTRATMRAADAANESAHTAQRQTDILTTQTDILNRGTIRIEQPVLQIRLHKNEYLYAAPEQDGNYDFPGVKFSFFNYGKTPAILDYASCDLMVVVNSPPPPSVCFPPHINPTHKIRFDNPYVQSGDLSDWRFPSKRFHGSRKIKSDIQELNAFLFLHGFVQYGDLFGYTHRSYFCLEYVPALAQFEPLRWREYNYSEMINGIPPAPSEVNSERN